MKAELLKLDNSVMVLRVLLAVIVLLAAFRAVDNGAAAPSSEAAVCPSGMCSNPGFCGRN